MQNVSNGSSFPKIVKKREKNHIGEKKLLDNKQYLGKVIYQNKVERCKNFVLTFFGKPLLDAPKFCFSKPLWLFLLQREYTPPWLFALQRELTYEKPLVIVKDVNYSHEVARVEPCDNDSESQSNGKSFLEHLYYLFWHANRLGDIIAVPPPLPEPPDMF